MDAFQIVAVVVTFRQTTHLYQGGILALADKRYDVLQKLNQMDSFYDYERQFVDIGRFKGNFGAIPANKRKKTSRFFKSDKYEQSTGQSG
ncbi:MAG: hypothetical protein ORN54_08335 [Cyclobacteriaceae bacterium]|nr:hypothetical protein [Cyclobacteriaceae bacterium]